MKTMKAPECFLNKLFESVLPFLLQQGLRRLKFRVIRCFHLKSIFNENNRAYIWWNILFNRGFF